MFNGLIGKRHKDNFIASDNDVIVSIDFGTSRTGVVYGIRKSISIENLEVQPLEGAGVVYENDKKTLTAILLSRKQNNEPIAYGHKARMKYSDEQYKDDYFFRCFKMNLHNQFEMDPPVAAANGKTLPLSIIIQKSLEFIKKNIMDSLYSKGILLSKNPYDIVWSLTVPAIWTDVAKSIMRKSAFNAGMIETETSNKLIIALEPECAFIGAINIFKYDQSLCSIGKKFLVVDCGGGTIDITGHVVSTTDPFTVTEIIAPDGGYLGSTLIDKRFYDFIKQFIGDQRYNELSKMEDFDIIELEKLWEECKLAFSFDKNVDESVRINLSCILQDCSKDLMQKLIDDWNKKYTKLTVRKGGSRSLNLSFDLIMSFFEKPIEDIIEKVSDVLGKNRDKLEDLDYIILAGGFCKNIYLNQRINEEFRDKRKIKVLTGKDADLLIVRGAAIFTSDLTSIIKTRKARYTFGIMIGEEYCVANERHRRYASKKYVSGNDVERIDVFQIHGRIGDDIEIGKSISKQNVWPMAHSQVTAAIKIYISTQYDPFHISEIGTKCLAVVKVPLDTNKPFSKRSLQIEFSFGMTEVICNVYDQTGKFVKKIPLDYTAFFD